MKYIKEFLNNFFKMTFMVLISLAVLLAIILFVYFGFSLASDYFGNLGGILFVLFGTTILGSGIYAYLETEDKHLKDEL